MESSVQRPRLEPLACGLVALLCMLGPVSRRAQAVEAGDAVRNPGTDPKTVEERVRELERRYSLLADENRRLEWQVRELSQGTTEPTPEVRMPPETTAGESPLFDSGYSQGFFISPRDPEKFPFEFKFNNQAQLRHVAFARDVRTWTDSAGIVSPVTDRNAFELSRGRAILSGYAFAPEFTYNLTIDYTTASVSQINFWNYWVGYQFNRGVSLFIGQAQVPGTREWLTPAIYTLGPDYSLATTFFRPSLSQGIWATGEPVEGLHYRAMFSNGFNTLGSRPDELDSRMTFSGSVWAEPLGEFGRGFSDFEWHEDPAIRLGTSFTYSPILGQQGDPNLPENNDIRLTDGTLVGETGALAPGVTLTRFLLALGAIDFAWKYRGISLSGEFYVRDMFDLQADGAITRSSIFDYGGYAQLGCFVLPRKLELYGRTSQVTEPFGSGSEYAGGLNWFLLPDKQNMRLTFDVTWVNHSPADQSRSDYRAGDTGLLIRSQFQFFF